MCRNRKPYAVLIIDDDAPIRRIVKTQLGGGEYDVYEAENREQVAHVLDLVRLDAVICDIKMKDADGFELTRGIRERFPGLPVIILTGLIERENEQTARGLGCFDFLIKPVKREKLRDVVGRAVGRRADAAE
jgi:two-component system response regulator YesN